jgi:CheY-like chemotaxis protein
VLKGESTIDELLRVVDVPQDEEPAAGAHRKGARVSDPKIPARTSGAVAAPSRPSRPVEVSPASSVASAPPPTPVDELAAKFELIDTQKPSDGPRLSRDPQATVLLVDDEDQLRRVMRDLLEREGYRVAEAQNGIEALDQVDRHAPDIVVLDLNLPGLDGYGVLSHLRSRPATSKIPVVVLTARGDEDNEVRVLELGADDFLSKPFRARALSARLKTILGRRYGRAAH